MKRLLGLVLAVSFAVPFTLLAGCNTVAGAGKDIQQGGAKIQSEAQEHRN